MSYTGRLYMAVHVYGEDAEPPAEWELELVGLADPIPESEPEGWREHALEMWGTEPREGEHWPNGYKPFFWPKTDVPYKSRSTAQARVDIINRWGGKAVVLECTPRWESVEAANKRRAADRLNVRIAKKRDELEVLLEAQDRIRPREMAIW